MSNPFSPDVIAAVLHHMNDDHRDDSVLIGRAFGGDDVSVSVMTGFDADGGTWQISRSSETDGAATTPEDLQVPWPSGSISERAEVRREIVALYDAACAKLGITPRPH